MNSHPDHWIWLPGHLNKILINQHELIRSAPRGWCSGYFDFKVVWSILHRLMSRIATRPWWDCLRNQTCYWLSFKQPLKPPFRFQSWTQLAFITLIHLSLIFGQLVVSNPWAFASSHPRWQLDNSLFAQRKESSLLSHLLVAGHLVGAVVVLSVFPYSQA